MKLFFRKILSVLICLGLIALVLNILVDNPYTHRLVAGAINEHVARYTNVKLDFKAIKLRAFPVGLDLYGLQVATFDRPVEPIIETSQLKIRLSHWALFMGEVRYSLIEAQDLNLTWSPPLSLDSLLKNSSPNNVKQSVPGIESKKFLWPLFDDPSRLPPIEELRLSDSALYVELPIFDGIPHRPHYAVTSAKGINASLTWNNWSALELQISSESVDSAIDSSSTLENTSIETSLSLVGSRLTASKIKLAGERLNFSGTASVLLQGSKDFKPFRILNTRRYEVAQLTYSMHGQGTGELSLLGSLLDLPGTRGGLTFTTTINGVLPLQPQIDPTFKARGNLSLQDGRIDDFRLFDSLGTYEASLTELLLKDIDVRIGNQSYGSTSGRIAFNEVVDYRFVAMPKKLPLPILMDALTVDFYEIATDISSPNLVIEGQGDPFELQAYATGLFEDITLRGLPETGRQQIAGPLAAGPNCIMAVDIKVDSQQVDFGKTKGYCMDPDQGSAHQKLPQNAELLQLLAKHSARFATHLNGSSSTGKVAKGKTTTAPPLKKSNRQVSNQSEALGKSSPPIDWVLINLKRSASPLRIGGLIATDDRDTISMQIGSPRFNLAILAPTLPLDIAGLGQLGVDLHGTSEQLDIAGTFKIAGLMVEGLELGEASGHLLAKDNLLTDLNATVAPRAGGSFKLRDGKLNLDNLHMDANLQAADIDPATITAFAARLDLPFSMQLDSFSAALTGPLLKPLKWLGDLELAASHASYADSEIFDSLQIESKAAADGLSTYEIGYGNGSLGIRTKVERRAAQFTKLAQNQPSDQLKKPQTPTGILELLGGSVDDIFSIDLHTDEKLAKSKSVQSSEKISKSLKKNRQSKLASRQLPLDIADLPLVSNLFKDLGVQAQMTLAAQVKGPLGGLQGTFDGSLKNPQLLAAELPDVDFKGFIEASNFDLIISQGGDSLEGRLSFDLKKSGIPFSWYLKFRRTDLRAFTPAIFHQDPRNFAYLSATWQMAGQMFDWWNATGQLDIEDIRAQYIQDVGNTPHVVTIGQEQPVSLVIDPKGWHMVDGQELQLTSPRGKFNLAVGPMQPPHSIALNLDGVVDVELLKELYPTVDTASGKLVGKVELTGSVNEPILQMELTDQKK